MGSRRVHFATLPFAEECGSESSRPSLYEHAIAMIANTHLAQAVSGAGEVPLAACSWATCSIGMTLLNKTAVARTHAPIALVILQMFVTFIIAFASRARLSLNL